MWALIRLHSKDYVVLGGFLAVVLVVAYAWVLARMARTEVSRAPKKEMFLCDVHGPLPIEHTLQLFEGLMELGTDQVNGQPVRKAVRACPICMEDKLKQAKK